MQRQTTATRLDGLPPPPPAASTLPSASTTESPQLSATIDNLCAMMGRFETCLTDLTRAVRPLTSLPRPDPDPPYSRHPGSHLALNAGPSWSTTTAVPSPPGFTATPSASRSLGLPPSVLQPNPPHHNPITPNPSTNNTNPTYPTPHQPTNIDPSRWSPPVTTPYNTAHIKPSSWDIPPQPPQPKYAMVRQPSCWDHPDTRARATATSQDHRRHIKMDPPRFDGSDAPNWISRVEYYFDHIQLPVDQRLHYVIMLFDPPAAEWIFNYRANNTYVQWHEFLEEVRRRFDPLYFQDFTGLIAKLTQTGSLTDYNTRFESMLTRVRDMPESTRLSIYVEGLQQPFKTQVRHQHPSSVAAAMALAVEFAGVPDRQSSSSAFNRRSWPAREPRFPTPTVISPVSADAPLPKPTQLKGSPYSRLPVIRLSAAEKADRTKRGLCWYCQEKFGPSHTCNKTFLAYMGVDEDAEDDTGDLTADQPTAEIITDDISHLYALNGRHRTDAIHLHGTISASPVLILVDTGSTHDFLHPRIAESLALPLQKIKPFRVYVGNGESLLCSHASVNTRLVIQNQVFLIDLHILPIHGPDVILGMAWWKSLRRVTCDHDDETLEFNHNGNSVRLRIAPQGPQQISVKSFASLMSYQHEAELFEIIAVPHAATGSDSDEITFPDSVPAVIADTLRTHSPVFRLPVGMPPPRFCDHRIHLLPNTKPVNVRPYRYPYFQKNEIERQVKEMLANGIIRPSQSSFSSPVLLIRKKDGTFRFCIDYRALNTATVPDHFPIPTSDELFDELGKARFFTKLDLRSGYHQIRMHTDDVYKTAFRTHDGHFEFLVMPFGLTNAPSTFQAAMNAIFRPLLRKFVIVFFDDILIYSPCLDTHNRHLHEVLSILHDHTFFIKLSKCSFCSTTVDYLGHLIADGELKADPSKIEAMVAWPIPTTIKHLRGFLGLTGYYRRFIARYAMIAAPLTELLKKDAFLWSPAAQSSFEALKAAMTSAPVLRLPDFDRTFYIETDASDLGIGAVLIQDNHPLAFFSKKLGPRRRVTSTYHKELYAIVEAVQKWRQYLLGREFVIRSDQKSLKELLQQIIQTPDQQLYARKLMGYKFRIEYKTGASNKVADALSRRDTVVQDLSDRPSLPVDRLLTLEDISPTAEEADACLFTTVSHPVPDIMDLIREDTNKSTDLIDLRDKIASGHADTRFTCADGLIYFQRRVFVGSSSVIRTTLLYEHHSTPTAGHPGVDRTFRRLAFSFYWKNMRKDVKSFVEACVECQTTKYSTQKPAGLLQPLPIPSQVWEDVSMDFITGLPQSRGFTVIMVVVDRLSKYAHFAPLPTSFNALRVANLFIDTVVKHHGFPRTLVSDRDSVFLNDVWEDMLRLSGTRLHFTTAYHPQSDGQTEVRNRGLEQYLRAFTSDRPNKWANFLPWAELALNCFHHEGLGTSPFAALYGREPPALIAAPPKASTPPDVSHSIRQRGDLIVYLRQNLEKAQHRMATSANRHRRDIQFEVGDNVWLKLQLYRQYSVARPLSSKLSRRFYGPFEIIERIGAVAYRLRLPEGSRIHNVFHVSLLRRFVDNSQFANYVLPAVFNRGRPVARPTSITDRRTVLLQGVPREECLVQWQDDQGSNPTWEPLETIERRFPHLLVDKQVVMEGGVDTCPTLRDEDTTMEDNHPSYETDQVPETTLAPAASEPRPQRSRRRPDRLGDYVAR